MTCVLVSCLAWCFIVWRGVSLFGRVVGWVVGRSGSWVVWCLLPGKFVGLVCCLVWCFIVWSGSRVGLFCCLVWCFIVWSGSQVGLVCCLVWCFVVWSGSWVVRWFLPVELAGLVCCLAWCSIGLDWLVVWRDVSLFGQIVGLSDACLASW